MFESDGRVRNMGCEEKLDMYVENGIILITYLNDGKTKNGSSYVADEHRRKGGNKHISKQHSSRLRAGFAQDERRKALVNFTLGQGSSEGKTAK
jgi:hypothetical protein